MAGRTNFVSSSEIVRPDVLRGGKVQSTSHFEGAGGYNPDCARMDARGFEKERMNP